MPGDPSGAVPAMTHWCGLTQLPGVTILRALEWVARSCACTTGEYVAKCSPVNLRAGRALR